MRGFRLEFLQPDGRWTGSYTAEYMTPQAFELREAMLADHKVTRPYPQSETFAANPGKDRYVCASPSLEALQSWFNEYLALFQAEGGHIGEYEIPESAIAEYDGQQIVYQQRQARCMARRGKPIPVEDLIERFHPDKLKEIESTVPD